MQLISLIIAGTFFLNSGCAENSNQTNARVSSSEQSMQINSAVTENVVEAIPDHSTFDALLQKYVSEKGAVDYAGFKKDEAALDKYCATLAKAIPAKDWNKDASLAYWINAYNAFTIKLILKNYPVKSITDISKGKPWDEKWIKLGSQTYSLNNIENDIIRPTYKEPRIHFALNCAAVSCPPLANKAFTAVNLESMLATRTIAFVNSSANDLTGSKIQVSKIFDWYGEDFGNVVSFLNKYANKKVSSAATVGYKDYDWKLNGK